MTVINKILQAELWKTVSSGEKKNGGKHENRHSGELKSNFLFVDGQL